MAACSAVFFLLYAFIAHSFKPRPDLGIILHFYHISTSLQIFMLHFLLIIAPFYRPFTPFV